MYSTVYVFWDQKRAESTYVFTTESGEESESTVSFMYSWKDTVEYLMSKIKSYGLRIVDQYDLYEDRFIKEQTFELA